MRKLFLLMLVLATSMHFVFAQEGFDISKFNGISLGGGASISSHISGGFIDLGFNIYSKGNFAIRNYVEIYGGGTSGNAENINGVFGIRERLIFSGITPITDAFGVRGYGGFDFAFSVFGGSETKSDYFKEPFLLTPRGFGGIEFLFASVSDKPSGSFFIESGGGSDIRTGGGDSTGFAFISAGGRVYF